jgi:hypothetical protein
MNEIFTLPRRKKGDGRRRADKTRLRRPRPLEGRAYEPPAPVAGVDPTARHASMGQLPGAVCCELERLYASLGQVTPASNPRTFKLLEAGTRKIAQKVIEEADEVALEGQASRAWGSSRKRRSPLPPCGALAARWRRPRGYLERNEASSRRTWHR